MSGQQHHDGDAEGRERLIPTKQTLTALKSDVTRESAIKELIDNALDAWHRNSNRTEPVTIDIAAEEKEDGRTALVIRDDAGGVPREQAKMVFTLGMTAKSTGGGVIGTFGLGAKKALVNLGVPFTIASHHEDEEFGWEYTIDEEWLQDDENWEVEIESNEELEPGTTEITVHDLDYEWFPEEDEEVNEEKPLSPAEELRQDIARTYNLFLEGGIHEKEYDLTIQVDGEEVDPLGLPDWTYTPFDGMHARRFDGIPIEIDGMPDTNLHITVGLLRKSSTKTAGVDVYCQRRRVVGEVRDERVGFGRELDEFTSHHERLKVIVEMETEEDARDLPWDTQKSNLDPHNPIMEEARNWISRAINDYHKLTDSLVPRAFVESYHPESEYAANDGEIEVLDYSNRSYVISKHRPDNDLPQLTSVRKKAEAHAELHFRCERELKDWEVPAYQRHVEYHAEVNNYTSLQELSVDPVDLDEDEAKTIAREIEKLVDRHKREEVKYTEALPDWQVPKYEYEMSGADIEMVEELPDGVPANLEDLGEESQDGEEATKDQDDIVETGFEAGTEGQPEEEDNVEVLLQVSEEGSEMVGSIMEMERNELAKGLGLGEDADRDKIAVELKRRLELSIEMSTPTTE